MNSSITTEKLGFKGTLSFKVEPKKSKQDTLTKQIALKVNCNFSLLCMFYFTVILSFSDNYQFTGGVLGLGFTFRV